jgi:hypothetical protein
MYLFKSPQNMEPSLPTCQSLGDGSNSQKEFRKMVHHISKTEQSQKACFEVRLRNSIMDALEEMEKAQMEKSEDNYVDDIWNEVFKKWEVPYQMINKGIYLKKGEI